ncbi:hypothetical protein SAMN05428995_105304 [Loktanella sp. DSM 29012]|uniref:hypothetical protein n=1 Tax=Loktanella sp. DSM 29012 TaxID=1881056 RepID=UPI0008B36DD7|nr:hypothetical protein [Loktanella sp. DSM 29012]SEQ61399.1 hypothetical protein SAMN05428995_105304 [Loktanella sp. DSM 29012]
MDTRLFQDWLDHVSDCVVADDFEDWAGHFGLPLSVDSDIGQSVIATNDALHEKFMRWRQMFEAHAVNNMIRTVRDVTRAAGDTIVGYYDTDILHDGKRMKPRFSSHITLKLQGNTWRCVAVRTGMQASDRHLFHTPSVQDHAAR